MEEEDFSHQVIASDDGDITESNEVLSVKNSLMDDHNKKVTTVSSCIMGNSWTLLRPLILFFGGGLHRDALGCLFHLILDHGSCNLLLLQEFILR